MTAEPGPLAGSAAPARETSARLLLLACSATHFINDGLMSSVYPLLPYLAADFRLSYAAVGLVKTSLTGAASLFQVPAGFLAERVGEQLILGLGMVWLSAGFLALGLAAAFWQLVGLAVLAGVGSSTQHPLGAAIVSRAYERSGRGTAVSTLNFAGDLGKVAVPFLAGLAALAGGWRGASLALGLLGLALALAFTVYASRARRSLPSAPPMQSAANGRWGIRERGRFALLTAIGVIDDSTRTSTLTFLPFLLVDKGMDAAAVSFLIALIFGCGAAGKLGCGILADRFGNVALVAITELVTALAVVLVVPAAAVWLIPLLVVFGFVLNGTSSVLYATVADMVDVERRARGYALFYTITLGLGTASPILYGLVADRWGIPATFFAIAGLTLITVPLALGLRVRRTSREWV